MTRRPRVALASRRQALAAAGVAWLAGWGTRAQAQGSVDKARESLVKAAFLHKFPSFVEWPEGSFARPEAPLKIAVMGDEQVLRDLRELARDRDRDGRPVTVSRVAPGDALAGYHIVYLKAASVGRAAELLSQVPEGVLTVADSDGAHPRGSVLSFFVEDGRVRFGVSVEAAARQRLRLSSRLLSVARSVQGARQPWDDLPPDTRGGPPAA